MIIIGIKSLKYILQKKEKKKKKRIESLIRFQTRHWHRRLASSRSNATDVWIKVSISLSLSTFSYICVCICVHERFVCVIVCIGCVFDQDRRSEWKWWDPESFGHENLFLMEFWSFQWSWSGIAQFRRSFFNILCLLQNYNSALRFICSWGLWQLRKRNWNLRDPQRIIHMIRICACVCTIYHLLDLVLACQNIEFVIVEWSLSY